MALSIGQLVGFITLDPSGFDKELDDAGEKLKSGNSGKMKAAAIAGGALVGVALAAGVFQAMDLQASNAKLAGQLGLSADTAARFGKIAGQVYSDNWGESIDEVNDAIAAITRNIGEGNDAWLQDTTETILAMQSTFGAGADEISRSVAQMLNTGLAENSAEALDLLTKSFQNGNDRAGDLLDTMDEYGTQFRKLGVDGPMVMGLISQGLQAGARDADVVADSFKEFSLRALDGSAAAAAGFDQLGVSGTEMANAIAAGGPAAEQMLDILLDRLRGIQDPVQRNAAALALFGTKAEDLGDALYSLDPSEATQALGDFTGAAATMADTVGTTASGNIESFKRRLQTTFTTVVGGVVIPMLTLVTGWFSSHLGPAIEGVSGFLKDHQEAVKSVAIVLGVVAGAIGAVILVTKAWALAQAALNVVMTANPVGIVVVALAALVAGIVIAYNKVAWFRDLLNGVWAVIKVGWSAVAAIFSAVWHGVIEPVFTALGAAATWLYQNALKPAFDWISSKWDEISGKVQTLWVTRIQPSLAAFGAAAQELWQNYLSKLADWWGEHWPAMATALQTAWTSFIQPALSGIAAAVSWLYETVLVGLLDWVQTHWPEITAAIQSAASLIGTAFTVLGAVIGAVWAVVTGIWSAMQATWSAVSGAISGAANAVSSAFTGIGNAASTAWTTLTSAWSGAVAWFTGLKDTVVNALTGAGTWLIDTGKNIISGLLSGIRSAVTSLASTVSSLVKDAIPGPIRSALGISSPSRVMAEEVGQWIPKGIAMGIDQHADVVAAAMENLATVPTVVIPPVRGAGARGGDGASAGTAGTFATEPTRPSIQQVFNVQHMDERSVASYSIMLADAAGIG